MHRITLAILALCLLASPAAAAPKGTPPSIQEVPLVAGLPREYAVLVLFNDTVAARAVIDTGSTMTYLSWEVYDELRRTGAVIDARDLLPRRPFSVVGGTTYNAHRVRLTLSLGGWRIPNLIAVVGHPGGNVLLGSDVLTRFKSFGIDHTRGILRLGQPQD